MRQINRDPVTNCTNKTVCHSRFKFAENLKKNCKLLKSEKLVQYRSFQYTLHITHSISLWWYLMHSMRYRSISIWWSEVVQGLLRPWVSTAGDPYLIRNSTIIFFCCLERCWDKLTMFPSSTAIVKSDSKGCTFSPVILRGRSSFTVQCEAIYTIYNCKFCPVLKEGCFFRRVHIFYTQ